MHAAACRIGAIFNARIAAHNEAAIGTSRHAAAFPHASGAWLCGTVRDSAALHLKGTTYTYTSAP